MNVLSEYPAELVYLFKLVALGVRVVDLENLDVVVWISETECIKACTAYYVLDLFVFLCEF